MFSSIVIIFGSQLYSLDHSLSAPSVILCFLEVQQSLHLSTFICLFAATECWDINSLLLIYSFHLLSVPVGPSKQYFCRLKVLYHLVGFSCMLWEFPPLDKSLHHRHFLKNLYLFLASVQIAVVIHEPDTFR